MLRVLRFLRNGRASRLNVHEINGRYIALGVRGEMLPFLLQYRPLLAPDPILSHAITGDGAAVEGVLREGFTLAFRAAIGDGRSELTVRIVAQSGAVHLTTIELISRDAWPAAVSGSRLLEDYEVSL